MSCVISEISTAIGYPPKDASEYLTHQLRNILQYWLTNNRLISEIPHSLFGFSTEVDFYRANLDVIVPMLFLNKKEDILEEIATKVVKLLILTLV